MRGATTGERITRAPTDVSGASEASSLSGPPWLAWLAMVAALLLGLGLAAWCWDRTWDDAAITLGYARTFARHGDVTFGAYGERTEGFSSALWMLVAAVLARFAETPDRLLAWARFVNALLYVLNAVCVYRLSAHYIRSDALRAVAVIFFLLEAISVVSIPDGMENHLFLTLHLLMALAWLRAGVEPGAFSVRTLLTIAALSVGLVLCRPEGGLMWMAVLAATVLGRRRGAANASVLAGAVVGGAGIVALLLFRRFYFHAWLPNTVLAKTWAPYWVPPGERMLRGLENVQALVLPVCLPLAAMFWALRPDRRATRLVLERAAPLVIVVGAFLLYAVTAGAIWGTTNRIFLSVIPFATLLLLAILDHESIRLTRDQLALACALFAAIQAPYYANYRANAVTVAGVRALNRPAAELARRYPGEVWRLAAPDVGATLLYWGESLEIVDTALLNNVALSREGWSRFDEVVLTPPLPEILETHAPWSALAGLGSSKVVRDAYVKVTVDRVFYLLRRDVIERLRAAPPALTIEPVAGLGEAAKREILSRVHTDFTGDPSGVDDEWRWNITLDPEGIAASR